MTSRSERRVTTVGGALFGSRANRIYRVTGNSIAIYFAKKRRTGLRYYGDCYTLRERSAIFGNVLDS